MKMMICAIALVAAAPLHAQTAAPADPHAGHAQQQQHGQSQHGRHHQDGHAGHKMDCCKDGAECRHKTADGKMPECCAKHAQGEQGAKSHN